jgi:hypothetical protein
MKGMCVCVCWRRWVPTIFIHVPAMRVYCRPDPVETKRMLLLLLAAARCCCLPSRLFAVPINIWVVFPEMWRLWNQQQQQQWKCETVRTVYRRTPVRLESQSSSRFFFIRIVDNDKTTKERENFPFGRSINIDVRYRVYTTTISTRGFELYNSIILIAKSFKSQSQVLYRVSLYKQLACWRCSDPTPTRRNILA